MTPSHAGIRARVVVVGEPVVARGLPRPSVVSRVAGAVFACAVVLAIVLAGRPGGAQAQDEGDPPPQDAPGDGRPPDTHPENIQATQQAREHFMAGAAHFESHRYREAIESFREAARLVPSADLWFNIARAYEELSRYGEAIEHYELYLRDRVDPPDQAEVERLIVNLRERAEAERLRGQTQPTTGTLRLTVNRPGSEVQLDGEAAEASPWEAPRDLAPGRHRLAVLRDGYIPFRSEVSLEAGVTTAAYSDLVPETRYRSLQADRIFTWVAWGLGVAALGVSIGLGVESSSLQSTNLDEAHTWAAYSDVALGSAIGLAVVGLILYFVEGRSVGTERITVADEDASPVRGTDD